MTTEDVVVVREVAKSVPSFDIIRHVKKIFLIFDRESAFCFMWQSFLLKNIFVWRGSGHTLFLGLNQTT